MKNKKTNLSKLLKFLFLRMKLNKEVTIPISKKFMKRYRKVNKKAIRLSKFK